MIPVADSRACARLRTEQRLHRWVLLGIFGALACGDGPEPPPNRILLERFETTCGDLPCGWSQVAGDPGDARYVSTFHPGEHALALSGSDVVAKGPGGAADGAQILFGSLQARIAARCDAGNTLVVRVVLNSSPDGGPVTYDELEGRFSPPTGYGSASMITLTAASTLNDGGFGGGPFGSFLPVEVVAITVSKTGSGTCEIGEIIIDDIGSVPLDEVVGC